MTGVGVAGLRVIDSADNGFGKRGFGDGFDGFSRQVSQRSGSSMPVPPNPAEEGWRAIQITMPFQKQPINGSGQGVVILGFQFAWSKPRSQWIPYAAVMYSAPDEFHAAVPFR